MLLRVRVTRCSYLREYSSVGSEHLPYKQRVIGSNPITPTKASRKPYCWLFCNGERLRRQCIIIYSFRNNLG